MSRAMNMPRSHHQPMERSPISSARRLAGEVAVWKLATVCFTELSPIMADITNPASGRRGRCGTRRWRVRRSQKLCSVREPLLPDADLHGPLEAPDRLSCLVGSFSARRSLPCLAFFPSHRACVPQEEHPPEAHPPREPKTGRSEFAVRIGTIFSELNDSCRSRWAETCKGEW